MLSEDIFDILKASIFQEKLCVAVIVINYLMPAVFVALEPFSGNENLTLQLSKVG